MPRKRRTSKRRPQATRFSRELEAYLSGDDSCFADADLFKSLWWELFIDDDRRNSMLTAAEKRRIARFEAEDRRRAAELKLQHYHDLAVRNGYLGRWQKYLAKGEDPSFAFTYAQQDHIAELSAKRKEQP